MEWIQAKPYSFWGSADVGLTSSSGAGFPKAAASGLTPGQLEMEHAEALINFLSFLSHPATAKQRINTGGPPPPPPRSPESSWDSGATTADYGRATQAPPNLFAESGGDFALQELAGVDLLGMFQGAQRAETESFSQMIQKPKPRKRRRVLQPES